ncbi:hypothetical protein H257_08706 [Aphanomyces astaci]|uniref:Uncharacterized protein n=1 Tax=Aphanomyces astaci TaxID=112090 RepID=W4GDV6_APHAT|nr:hypothetical protein H257_08706 [Aphanomyces astaci]ETV77249.1 hypothetical protein H257_08706 [Aphanomyces astaci]|eukprot:XP_009833036.1 hypothetical protein H257_08706 [Aphanomyces astaci]
MTVDFRWCMAMQSYGGAGGNMCTVSANTGILAVAMGSFVDLYLLQDMEESSIHPDGTISSSSDVHIPFAAQVCLRTHLWNSLSNETDNVVATCVHFVDNTLLVGTLTTRRVGSQIERTASIQGFRVFGGTTSVVTHHAFSRLWKGGFTKIVAFESMGGTSTGVFVLAAGQSTTTSVDAITWTDRCVSIHHHAITSAHESIAAIAFQATNEGGGIGWLAVAHAAGLAIYGIHNLHGSSLKSDSVIATTLTSTIHRGVPLTALAWQGRTSLCAGAADGATLVYQVMTLPRPALITSSSPIPSVHLRHVYPARFAPPEPHEGGAIASNMSITPAFKGHRFLHLSASQLLAWYEDDLYASFVVWPTDPWPLVEHAIALLMPSSSASSPQHGWAMTEQCRGMASVPMALLPRWIFDRHDLSEYVDPHGHVVVLLTTQALRLGMVMHHHPDTVHLEQSQLQAFIPQDEVINHAREATTDVPTSVVDEPNTVQNRYALPSPLPVVSPCNDPQTWTKQAYRQRLDHLHTRVDSMGHTIRSLRSSFQLFTNDVNNHMTAITIALHQVLALHDESDEVVAPPHSNDNQVYCNGTEK